ncbi:MAG: formate--tetrahydrofolate ligase [Oscillospiraceae bacterium]|nr:formate--tetrahydrofolate ligase [Oscillospiraceae bacterium]
MNENLSSHSEELEKINIISFLNDLLHRLRSFWWVILLLTVAFGAASYYRTSTHYSPSYTAEATVSVEIVNGGSNANRNTAEQLGVIFPYILTSGALSDVIAADLGLSNVPGSIQVSCISGTNLLTITVTGSNPNNVYAVLQSMLKNYPEVAQFVVGQTMLTVIDDSGIPEDTGRTSVLRGSLTRGAVVGFLLGAVLLMVYTVTTRTIRDEEDLRTFLNVPCLGTLPSYKKKRRKKNVNTEINILNDRNGSNSDYIESMRLIRTRLERQLGDKQVLMVTSSIPGEGKSTVAANLAISMARKGKSVILIDCDLRNPTQGKVFGLKGKYPGLVPVLQGKAKLEDALYEVTDHGEPIGLTLLPGADHESKLVEILGSEEMRELLEKLKKRVDVVILDSPPSAMLVDAMIMVQHVDGVVYVVMSDFAKRSFIFRGMDELTSNGVEVLGCILNGGKTRSKGYGYYGSKGYGYYSTGTKAKSE